MDRSPRPRAAGFASAVTRAVREWPGWFAVAAGAVLCVLGWYGVSGESVVEQQVPYLASATVPGAALIVAGAVLGVGRSAGRGERADRRIEQLYALLVEDPDTETPDTEAPDPKTPDRPGTAPYATADAPTRASADTPLALPEGTLYHRRDCPLIAGKTSAEPVVDSAVARQRSLAPCPVCDPPPPATPDVTPDAA